MRYVTSFGFRGSKIIRYLESPTSICLFTVQRLWCSDDDKGLLYSVIAGNFIMGDFRRKFSNFGFAQNYYFGGIFGG